ncbi:hypothetical protein ACU4GD_24705 [Cupriavidus basilensis]
MSSIATPTLSTDDIAGRSARAGAAYMVRTLSEFVAAPSPSGQEQPAVAFMEGALRELGLEPERIYLRSETLKDPPLFSPPCCPDGGRYNPLATHRPVAGRRPFRVVQRPSGCGAHRTGVDVAPVALCALSSRTAGSFSRGAGDMKPASSARWPPTRR